MNYTPESLEKLQTTIDNFKEKEQILFPKPTLFEIAGFPSRENVFSNFLKFYCDSRANHGFGVSVLKALLTPLGDFSEDDLQTIKIDKEVCTESFKRIDLIIQAKQYTIAIENKVYHVLNNDLKDYSEYLEEFFDKRKLKKIVLNLSIDNINPTEQGFVFISYKTFLHNLKETIMQPSVTNKYYIFFQEFIQNIKNHYPNNMEPEQIKFVQENETKINAIKELSNRALNYMNTRISDIQKLVQFNTGKWEHYQEISDSFEWHSKTNEPFTKVGLTIEISKIYIEVSVNKECRKPVKEFLGDKYYQKFEWNKDWLYIKEFSPIYNATDEQIAQEIKKLMTLLEEFIPNAKCKETTANVQLN